MWSHRPESAFIQNLFLGLDQNQNWIPNFLQIICISWSARADRKFSILNVFYSMFVGHLNYSRFWRGIRINLFLPSWCFNGSPDDMTYCLECVVVSILQKIDETLYNEKFFPPVWSTRETVALFWISHKHFFWQWIEQHKMWLYCQALLFALFQTNREALDYSFEQQWQSSLSCLDKTHSISNFQQQ